MSLKNTYNTISLTAIVLLTLFITPIKAASSTADIYQEPLNSFELSKSDDFHRLMFDWDIDFGLKQNNAKKKINKLAIVGVPKKLIEGDWLYWWGGISRDKKAQLKDMLIPAIDRLIKPEPGEVALSLEKAESELDNLARILSLTGKGAQLTSISLDTVESRLKTAAKQSTGVETATTNQQLSMLGKLRKNFDDTVITLGRQSKVKTFASAGINKLLGVSGATTYISLGAWSIDQFVKLALVDQVQSTRALELELFLDELGNKLDPNWVKQHNEYPEEIWISALNEASDQVLSSYEQNNVRGKLLTATKDTLAKAGTVSATTLLRGPLLAWEAVSYLTGVDKQVKAADKILPAQASIWIAEIAYKQNQEFVKQLKKSEETGEYIHNFELDSLRLSGLLALRASIQARELLVEGFQELNSKKNEYGSLIDNLKARNEEAYGFLSLWLD